MKKIVQNKYLSKYIFNDFLFLINFIYLLIKKILCFQKISEFGCRFFCFLCYNYLSFKATLIIIIEGYQKLLPNVLMIHNAAHNIIALIRSASINHFLKILDFMTFLEFYFFA